MKKVVIGKISKKNAFNFMVYFPRRVLVKFGFLLLLLSQMLKKSSLNSWSKLSCNFLDFFFNYIIRNNDDFLSSLISFKNDTLIKETNDSISLFLNKNEDEIYDEISFSLNKFYSLFPSLTQTKVYIYNSGFNYGIISYDDIVAIGLDNYLNENSKFYKMLSISDYLRKYKSKRYITANLIEVIFNSHFEEYYKRNNFRRIIWSIASKL